MSELLENKVLNAYKYFDDLNTDKENPLIKIFVSYIKPSFLFKSKILTPIHLGRAVATEISKDGKISEDDLKWLYENCIGDDDFAENISSVNRRVGFFTGTWWAYKNYEKIGSPKYFGSFGYRRLLSPEFLKDISKYDLILPKRKYFDNYKSIKEQLIANHGEKYYSTIISVIEEVYPEELEDVINYLNMPTGYFDELYVMKKDLFFDFCKWIFKIFQSLINKEFINEENTTNKKTVSLFSDFLQINEDIVSDKILKKKSENRDIAFIMERITGYYLYKTTQKNNVEFRELDVIQINTENTIIKKLLLNKMRNNIQKKIKGNNVQI